MGRNTHWELSEVWAKGWAINGNQSVAWRFQPVQPLAAVRAARDLEGVATFAIGRGVKAVMAGDWLGALPTRPPGGRSGAARGSHGREVE